MTRINYLRNPDVAVAWWVAIGVGAAGTYDFFQGQPPKGLLNPGANTTLAIFLIACAAAATLATLRGVVESSHRGLIRHLLLFVSVVPSLIADPTYSSLLIALPLLDVRRRDERHIRNTLTLLILSIVIVLLLTEKSPRITAEIEAMFCLGISFMIITMLGDTFRQLDQGLETRTELVQLNERMHLAEELHDSVGHHLLAASVQLQKATAIRSRDPQGSEQSVSLAQQAIAEAIADTRLIVSSTRDSQPRFDLESSIYGLLRRMSADGPEVTVEMHGDHGALNQITQLAFYRVVQESVSNLIRHANAAQAQIISTVVANETTLLVSDNGEGFTPGDIREAGGLHNMTRRIEQLGGTLDITSTSSGTSITAKVPR